MKISIVETWKGFEQGLLFICCCHQRLDTVCAEGNIFITVGHIFNCRDLVVHHSMSLSKLVFSHFQIQTGLSGEWQFPLSKPSLNNFHDIFRQGGRFSSHGSRPSQTQSWTWRTLTSNSKMLHTKGNLVNTSHPGCESSAAEWSKSGRGDFCDYGGVVTLFPKGE